MSFVEGAEMTSAASGKFFFAPLSFAQQRLWFLRQLYPASAAYNVPFGMRIHGELDKSALKKGIQSLVARHETLRTTVRSVDGVASQVIWSEVTITLREEKVDDANPTEHLQLLRNREAEELFDLEQGPLARWTLVTVSRTEHVLLITLHHLISDGWSAQVLCKELAETYGSIVENRNPALPELPIQYSDWVAFQNDYFKGERLESLLKYWKEKLSGAPDVLELPRENARPRIQTFKGANDVLELTPELGTRVNEFLRREKLTPFMLWLGVFKTLLFRYTSQTDIVIGSPVANRDRVELEPLIGFMANTVVLRTSLDGNLSFRDLLVRIRDTAVGAFAHQQLPFEKLVEDLHPERKFGHNPLFQIMLGVFDELPAPIQAGGVSFEEILPHTTAAKFDLSFFGINRAGKWRFMVEYNRELFSPSYIRGFLGCYETLLSNALTNPDGPLSALPMLPTVERKQITRAWNSTETSFKGVHTIPELFEAQVNRTPVAVAVKFESRELTYAELNSLVNSEALRLRNLGVGRDVLVGVSMERSVELIVSLLAVMKAGGAYVPLDPSYPAERFKFMLQDSGVALVMVQPHLVKKLSSFEGTILSIDSRKPPTFSANIDLNTKSGDLAYCIYTSGSTGQPKGALNTHRGICNRLLWGQSKYPIGPGDRVLQKTPFSFDVSVWEFFWPLSTGATLVIARPEGHRDPNYLVELIKKEQITNIHFVPSMLQVFLNEPGVEQCLSLKRVICSGEALSIELQRRFFEKFDCQLLNFYGPTEASVEATFWECNPETSLSFVPIGHPIANTQIYILNHAMEPVPPLVAGELHIGGVGVARGYHNRPELTLQKFVSDPFGKSEKAQLYKTGDLARYLPDGTIQYLGRVDFQVKIRGFRIELEEIETVLQQHPWIRQAVVVAHDDSSGDKHLIAYIVAYPAVHPETDTLREHIRRHLPEYMIPSQFIQLNELPLNSNGKVDRKLLPTPGEFEPTVQTEFIPPRNEIERKLATIWCDVLHLERAGANDNFFDLGGHSLLATQVVSRIRSTFQTQIPLSRFFESPTIGDLSLEIEKNNGSSRMKAAKPPSTSLSELTDEDVDRLLREEFGKG